MLSNFFEKWFGISKATSSPPPSDPRQSQTLSFTTTKSSLPKNSSSSSISIDFNVPDEFESRYDTPPMSLKRYLTDFRQQASRQSSLFSSLSCDSSLHSKIEEEKSSKKVPFRDILLPPCTPPLNILSASPPLMLPEIDEEFFPRPLSWIRSSSLPHAQRYQIGHFEDEENFMNFMLPSLPLPDLHDSQTTPSENCFIDEMLPLTISSCRNHHFCPEFPSPPNMPAVFSKLHVNQPSLFQEEQELSCDYDLGGYAPLQFGTEITKEIHVVRKLGFGHFATVWLCYDIGKKVFNAVKVSRSDPAYVETCNDEIRFLQRISDASSAPGSERVVKLSQHFVFESPFGKHCCASQEPLGRSLYQLIVQYDQVGFPLPVIQKLAFHMLEGLKFLHDACGIIHTDIKPENVTITCNLDDLRFLTKIALTDHVTAKKTAFAHAHFPSNITDRLELANSTIYFDGVKKLENSRQNLITVIWDEELKEIEGEYAEFARVCRAEDILTRFGDIHPSDEYGRRESGQSTSSDEKMANIEERLLQPEIQFKIVDLGTAQYRDNITACQFQTLQYRSPECVLKHEITPAIDIWSLACVLYEAATGDYLFSPRGNRDEMDRNRAPYDLFCCFIAILGSPPSDLRKVFSKNRIFNKLFDKNGKFIDEPNFGSPSLSDHINRNIDEENVEIFVSFMERMLCFNPERRGTAEDLLKHKWFKNNFGFNDEKKAVEDGL